MNARVLDAMNRRLELCTNSDTLVGKAGGSFHHPPPLKKQAGGQEVSPYTLFSLLVLSHHEFVVRSLHTNLFSKSPRPSVMDSVRVFFHVSFSSSCRCWKKQHNFSVFFPPSFLHMAIGF